MAPDAPLRHAALLVQVFLLCGKPSPDMPLRFVQVQHLPGLHGQGGIDLHETFCHVLMYRALADTKGLRRLSHRGIIVDDIVGNADGTLFDIILQRNTPVGYFLLLYEGLGEGMTGLGELMWNFLLIGNTTRNGKIRLIDGEYA